MDLESESSVLESVEDNELIVPSQNNLIDSNGVYSDETVGKALSDEMKLKFENNPVKKGNGLRKWKRIPRDSSKDMGNSVDNGTGGKRGFSKATPNSRNPGETEQRSEGSVSSTNAVVKSPGLFGPMDAATDSENSEDWSSKSSTAASAPRRRLEVAAVGGYSGDNGITSSNRDISLAAQRVQQGKNWTGSGKKPRGDQVKIETENSHSSMESDSQSSNFVFMQGATSSVTSKGRQSRRSGNYDGENSDDEARGSEQQRFAEKLQAGFKKSMAEFEDVSQSSVAADLNWDIKGENIENLGSVADEDPLVESITALQSAQEALAQELQKFREIGSNDSFLFGDVVQDSSPNSSEQYGEIRQTVSSEIVNSMQNVNELESEIVNLKQNVNELVSELAEARSMLEMKGSKVSELETSLKFNASRQEQNGEVIELEQKNSKELKSEHEDLFKQKIEAEVECLVVSRTFQGLRIAATAADKVAVLEEQKALATEQGQRVKSSENIGNKASLPKKSEIEVETGKYVKPGKSLCKIATLLLIQSVLLYVALQFFNLEWVPRYTEDVPT